MPEQVYKLEIAVFESFLDKRQHCFGINSTERLYMLFVSQAIAVIVRRNVPSHVAYQLSGNHRHVCTAHKYQICLCVAYDIIKAFKERTVLKNSFCQIFIIIFCGCRDHDLSYGGQFLRQFSHNIPVACLRFSLIYPAAAVSGQYSDRKVCLFAHLTYLLCILSSPYLRALRIFLLPDL